MVSEVVGIGGLSTEIQADCLFVFFSWRVTNGCAGILRVAQQVLGLGW